VVYFYTDRLREVKVKVEFPQGLLTEFYPPPRRHAPMATPVSNVRAAPPPDSLRGGMLDWGEVTLIPQSALRPANLEPAVADAVAARAFQSLPPGGDPEPELYTGDHYYYARATDSALVHVQLDNPNSLGPRGSFFEKFLFYRGIGNFELPLTAESIGDSFRITNRGAQAVTGLILVQVQGDDIRFSRLADLASGEAVSAAAPPARDGEKTAQNALWETMRQTLVQQGLYEAEARAMLDTWWSSWSSEEGTRLLYIVPRSLTDELLPLTIEPRPQELVRVLVGRMEILPQSEEQRIESILSASAAARRSAKSQPDAAPTVPAEITELGRLAEPALTRIAMITQDAAVRAEATLLIDLLRQQDAPAAE
jgi:hypothetical protein